MDFFKQILWGIGVYSKFLTRLASCFTLKERFLSRQRAAYLMRHCECLKSLTITGMPPSSLLSNNEIKERACQQQRRGKCCLNAGEVCTPLERSCERRLGTSLNLYHVITFSFYFFLHCSLLLPHNQLLHIIFGHNNRLGLFFSIYFEEFSRT